MIAISALIMGKPCPAYGVLASFMRRPTKARWRAVRFLKWHILLLVLSFCVSRSLPNLSEMSTLQPLRKAQIVRAGRSSQTRIMLISATLVWDRPLSRLMSRVLRQRLPWLEQARSLTTYGGNRFRESRKFTVAFGHAANLSHFQSASDRSLSRGEVDVELTSYLELLRCRCIDGAEFDLPGWTGLPELGVFVLWITVSVDWIQFYGVHRA